MHPPLPRASGGARSGKLVNCLLEPSVLHTPRERHRPAPPDRAASDGSSRSAMPLSLGNDLAAPALSPEGGAPPHHPRASPPGRAAPKPTPSVRADPDRLAHRRTPMQAVTPAWNQPRAALQNPPKRRGAESPGVTRVGIPARLGNPGRSFGSGMVVSPNHLSNVIARRLGRGTVGPSASSGGLRIELAHEMELVRDQALDLPAVIVEPCEKPVHRRLEVGKGRKILIVDRRLLE